MFVKEQGSINLCRFRLHFYTCTNVKIVFVGTGGGISGQVESSHINVPPSCVRLDKVLKSPLRQRPQLLLTLFFRAI
jgi:ribosomal protein S9